MSETSVVEVVKLLISERELIRRWKEFCDILRIPDHAYIPWETSYHNGTLLVYELFISIINYWTSSGSFPVENEGTVETLSNILEEDMQLRGISENLKRFFQGMTHPIKIIRNLRALKGVSNFSFGLRPAIVNFSGRNHELQFLKESFLNVSNSRTLLIHGLHGTGKTELVIKFLHDQQNERTEINIINVNGESSISLREDLINLAILLELTHEPNTSWTVMRSLRKIVDRIRQTENIFIVDNIEKDSNELKQMTEYLLRNIPPRNLFIVFIISTTSIETDSNLIFDNGRFQARSIHLKGFSSEEAGEYIQGALARNDNHDTIMTLSEKFSNFPITLHYGLEFIKDKQSTTEGVEGPFFGLNNYLQEVERVLQKAKLKKIDINRMFYFVIFLILERFKEKSGNNKGIFEILNLIVYFQPDNMSVELIKKLYNGRGIGPKNDFYSHLNLLESSTLLRRNPDGKFLNVHRLTQKMILEYLGKHYEGFFLQLQYFPVLISVLKHSERKSIRRTELVQLAHIMGQNEWISFRFKSFSYFQPSLILLLWSGIVIIWIALEPPFNELGLAIAIIMVVLEVLAIPIIPYILFLSLQLHSKNNYTIGLGWEINEDFAQALEYFKSVELLEKFRNWTRRIQCGRAGWMMNVIETHIRMAYCLYHLGRFNECVGECEIAIDQLQSRGNKKGSFKSSKLSVEAFMGEALYRSGCREDALVLLRSVKEQRINQSGANHPDTLHVKELIEEILRNDHQDIPKVLKERFEKLSLHKVHIFLVCAALIINLGVSIWSFYEGLTKISLIKSQIELNKIDLPDYSSFPDFTTDYNESTASYGFNILNL